MKIENCECDSNICIIHCRLDRCTITPKCCSCRYFVTQISSQVKPHIKFTDQDLKKLRLKK